MAKTRNESEVIIEVDAGAVARALLFVPVQDVRYYLNGLLFDLGDKLLRCVATDGHRLALCETPLEGAATAMDAAALGCAQLR